MTIEEKQAGPKLSLKDDTDFCLELDNVPGHRDDCEISIRLSGQPCSGDPSDLILSFAGSPTPETAWESYVFLSPTRIRQIHAYLGAYLAMSK